MKAPLLLLSLALFSVYRMQAQSCPPLNPGNDGSGIAVDLIISEINPGDYIELYNTTNSSIALSGLQHQFCSPFDYSALSTLSPATVIAAKGYATVPWPSNFSDTNAGGEVILYKNGNNFGAASNIIDFVCWGTIPHPSRKTLAESAGKWVTGSPCAGVLTNGAIHRIAGTTGVSALSYNVTAAPSALNCAPDPCAGISCNDVSACTTDRCNNGQCIFTPITCNDGNACTTDGCNSQSGCTTTPVVCNDGSACTTDGCNAQSGCTVTAVVCNDGSACTTDGCNPQSGCTVTAVVCNDGNACTTDGCNPDIGCAVTAVICNDGNACTTDGCNPQSGCTTTAVVCNDGNACTTDGCNSQSGCTITTIVCDDGSLCTDDTCINGCMFIPVDCDDAIACTSDTCDNGNCINTPVSCSINISGAILTELDSPVANVIVSLSGSMSSSDTITTDGFYSFNVSTDSSYTITPSKNNDSIPNNGVSTLDILLMQRHILQSQDLDSPYKIIAADVNGSGEVTTLDIVLTRALILANITSFQNGKLWEFVPDTHVFGDPLNPFPFPRSRSYENITELQTNQNFIGIKLGDVNGSWDPSP